MPFAAKRALTRHNAPVSRARWTADGKYVITCGHDKALRLWNPHRSEPAPGNETDADAAPTHTALPGGPALELALQVKEYSGPHGREVLDVAIARDNASFVSCGGDRTVFLWDVASGQVLRRLEGHSQRVNAVCFGGDDAVMASASYDQTVHLWDMRSRGRTPMQVLSSTFKDSVTSVCCSNYEIVTGCVDGAVRVHDLRVGKCHTDALGRGPITSAALSRDGRVVAAACMGSGTGSGSSSSSQKSSRRGSSSSDGGVVALLEKATGQALNTYAGHLQSAYACEVAFSHDDAYVLAGSEDNEAIVWDLVGAEVVQRLSGSHTKAVLGVTTHPKGLGVVTSSLDGTAIFWEGGAVG